jgi:sugar/nucleoside kinase (ribokinase family)
VISDLEQVELNVLMKANLVYIDLYQCIKTASLRALSYCLENKLPLFLNISNSVSDDELLAAIDLNGAGVIQASIAEDNFNQSEQSAKNLFNRCHPQLVIVTTGAHGATAYDGKTFHYADAIPIEPLHVHGAGAAFSAGFLSQFLRGKSLQECLDLGCAAGGLSCIKERIFEEISPTVIQAFMKKYNG